MICWINGVSSCGVSCMYIKWGEFESTILSYFTYLIINNFYNKLISYLGIQGFQTLILLRVILGLIKEMDSEWWSRQVGAWLTC